MRFASTTSNAALVARDGSARVRASRRTSRFRRALASVASIAIGSVSTPRARAAPSFTAAIARMPRAAADVEDARRRRGRPGPPAPRCAARHSRVVGWRPVPNAIPGSSAMTTSSGAARCRRQVGRMTSRRPTRRTGKCAFQASAQSASWTTRVRSSPIGRRPNAWRWPSASADLADGALGRRRDRAPAGRPATIAGRVGSRRAPRPSSTSSNAGSTVVPPGATRPRISLTASTASTSASTESSSQAPSGVRGVGRRRRAVAQPEPELLAQTAIGVVDRSRRSPRRTPRAARAAPLRELRSGPTTSTITWRSPRWPGPPQVRHALAAQPDLGAGLGARP